MTSREARYLVSTLDPRKRQELLEEIELKRFIHSNRLNEGIIDRRLYLFVTSELKGESPAPIDPVPVRHRPERAPTRYLLPGQMLGASA